MNSFALIGQTENIELDLLKAPISPASNLLGFAQSEIDKPTDISEFMLSAQSASNNFNKLPSNFAVDIAPFWLTKSKTIGDISTKGLSNSSGKNVIPQTAVLSFAIKNVEENTNFFNSNNTYAAIGFRFSIYRGEFDLKSKEAINKISDLQKLKLSLMNKNLDEVYDLLPADIIMLKEKRKQILSNINVDDDSDENLALIELLTIQASKIDEQIEAKIEILLGENKTKDELAKLDKKIKKIASEFQLGRVGFTWDLAGGISGDFQNKSFNQGKIYNAGIWTTTGYTTEKAGSFLGLIRYLYNPEQISFIDNNQNTSNDIASFDIGMRYIIGNPQSKFNASIEAVYRSFLSSTQTTNTWKLMFNADYAIIKNQKLTFSFGKNYDGTTTREGNLIAAIGTVFGFGNSR
jgi:hypothetical protein